MKPITDPLKKRAYLHQYLANTPVQQDGKKVSEMARRILGLEKKKSIEEEAEEIFG